MRRIGATDPAPTIDSVRSATRGCADNGGNNSFVMRRQATAMASLRTAHCLVGAAAQGFEEVLQTGQALDLPCQLLPADSQSDVDVCRGIVCGMSTIG